jgi:hypothetical protein
MCSPSGASYSRGTAAEDGDDRGRPHRRRVVVYRLAPCPGWRAFTSTAMLP